MEKSIKELENQIMEEIWPTMQAWGCKTPEEITLWEGPMIFKTGERGAIPIREVEESKFSVYFDEGKITFMGKAV